MRKPLALTQILLSQQENVSSGTSRLSFTCLGLPEGKRVFLGGQINALAETICFMGEKIKVYQEW